MEPSSTSMQLLFVTKCSLNSLSLTLLLSFPPSPSLSLTHCSGDEGLAPPADDIRRLEIAAALKLPVVSVCWEAGSSGWQKGQLEEEGWRDA